MSCVLRRRRWTSKWSRKSVTELIHLETMDFPARSSANCTPPDSERQREQGCLEQVNESCVVALGSSSNTFVDASTGNEGHGPGKLSVRVDGTKIAQIVNHWSSKASFKDCVSRSAEVLFPIKFQSMEQKINFFALQALCNFGRGYAKAIEQISQRSFDETQIFGFISMHISSGVKWDARFMRDIDLATLADNFGLPLETEEQAFSGVYVSKPSIFKDYFLLIQSVLRKVADDLVATGHHDFASFLLSAFEREKASTHGILKKLVDRVVDLSSVFHDEHELRQTTTDQKDTGTPFGDKVKFYTNAQRLVRSVILNVNGPWSDEATFMEEMNCFSGLADSTLIGVLRRLGIIQVQDPRIIDVIQNEEEISGKNPEILMRCAAVVAIDEIVLSLKRERSIVCSAWQIDMLLRDLLSDYKEELVPQVAVDENKTPVILHKSRNSIFF